MTRFRDCAIGLAALSVVAFFATLTYIAIQVNANNIAPITAALHGKHANGDDGLIVQSQLALSNARETLNAAKQVAQDSNRIAKSQELPAKALTASSIALVDAGKDTIAKLGGSVDALNLVISDVRTQTLPRLNSGVDSLDGLVGDLRPTAQELTGLVGESTNVVKNLNATVTTANGLLADPDLQKIAANLAVMSNNLNGTAFHLNGAALHAENALGYVETDLSPKHIPLWQSLLEGALGQAISIPLKYLPTRTAVVSSVPVQVAK